MRETCLVIEKGIFFVHQVIIHYVWPIISLFSAQLTHLKGFFKTKTRALRCDVV